MARSGATNQLVSEREDTSRSRKVGDESSSGHSDGPSIPSRSGSRPGNVLIISAVGSGRGTVCRLNGLPLSTLPGRGAGSSTPRAAA